MSRVHTQIDVPERVLAKKHGLWSSAYHLVHPVDGDVTPSDNDELMIYPAPFTRDGFDPMSNGSSGSGSVDALPLGSDISHRIFTGISYQLNPEYNVDCLDLYCTACNTDNTGVFCSDCPGYVEYFPIIMHGKAGGSTFGDDDPAARLLKSMRRDGPSFVEKMLWTGDCAYDDDESEFINYTSLERKDPASEGRDGVSALGDGTDGEKPIQALGLLLNAIGEDNHDVAMIHARPWVVDRWFIAGLLRTDVVDYGDGMGKREIITTKNGGHIVVSGGSYSGDGPEEDSPDDDQSWIFSTPMVYLAWNKIQIIGDLSSARFKTNDIEVSAEQNFGVFYRPQNVYAALVDMS